MYFTLELLKRQCGIEQHAAEDEATGESPASERGEQSSPTRRGAPPAERAGDVGAPQLRHNRRGA